MKAGVVASVKVSRRYGVKRCHVASNSRGGEACDRVEVGSAMWWSSGERFGAISARVRARIRVEALCTNSSIDEGSIVDVTWYVDSVLVGIVLAVIDVDIVVVVLEFFGVIVVYVDIVVRLSTLAMPILS